MFFGKKNKRLDEQLPLVKHKGVFRYQLTKFQGVALIVSATIGAGVLGIPYAIAKVGLLIGLIYIFGLGSLIIGLNLLIGGIAVRTKGDLQVVGMAKKYLGRIGEIIMILLRYVSGAGILVIYMIGVGETLSVLIGGSSFLWSLVFAVVGAILLFNGMKTIKVVDFFLSLAIILVVIVIATFSIPSIEFTNYNHYSFVQLLLPYGVILFALHGGSAVIEAHSILGERKKVFKSVIYIAGIINIIVYALFAIVVLGVTGSTTTEIATIGLGNAIGPIMVLFGNVFAVLAMSTSFIVNGLSLSNSLTWDYKIKPLYAVMITCIIPTIVFLSGVRQFIAAISIVGGIFVSLEMFLIVLIYWRAKQIGDLKPGKYQLHHTLLLAALIILALVVGAAYSIWQLF